MPLSISGLTISGGAKLRALPLGTENVFAKVDGKTYNLDVSQTSPTFEIEAWQDNLVVCTAKRLPGAQSSGLLFVDPDTDAVTPIEADTGDFRYASVFLSYSEDRLYGLSNSAGGSGVYDIVAFTSITSTSADIIQNNANLAGFPGGLTQQSDGTLTWGRSVGSNSGTGIRQTPFPGGPVQSSTVNTPVHSGGRAVVEQYNGTNLWVTGEANNGSTLLVWNVNSEDPTTGSYTHVNPAILTGRDSNGINSITQSAVFTTGNLSWIMANGVNKLAWTDDDGSTTNLVDMPNGLFVCDADCTDKGSYNSVAYNSGYFCATDNNSGTTGNNWLMRAKSNGKIEQLSQLPVPTGATVTLPCRVAIERDTSGKIVDIAVPIAFETGGGVKDLYMHRVPRNVWATFPGVTDEFFINVVSLIGFENGFVDEKDGVTWNDAGDAEIISTTNLFGSNELAIPSPNGSNYIERALPDLTGDFTIECWALSNSPDTEFVTLWDQRPTGVGTTSTEFLLIVAPSNGGKLQLWLNGSSQIESTGSVLDGQRHHVAVSRTGTTVSFFVDGVLEGTLTTSATIRFRGGSGDKIFLGAQSATPGNDTWDGSIDEFRLTDGVGRYTATFTPPGTPWPRD